MNEEIKNILAEKQEVPPDPASKTPGVYVPPDPASKTPGVYVPPDLASETPGVYVPPDPASETPGVYVPPDPASESPASTCRPTRRRRSPALPPAVRIAVDGNGAACSRVTWAGPRFAIKSLFTKAYTEN